MTEHEALVAFNMIDGLGSVKLASLVSAAGGDVVAAYENMPEHARLDWRGEEPRWEREIEMAEKFRVRIITMRDAEYPARLRDVSSPPIALYVAGDPAALSTPMVAMIGTRVASVYGVDTAHRFALGLATAGMGVVSGLAMGIDAAAHEGALAGKGVTVGVLGGALDEFFPEDNRKLGRQIAASGGAVVSEFPFGRKPDRQTFPQRNRIVSGLSLGVVAVECPLQSGTMITASLAADQGRPVMAVPGRVDSRLSAGCHSLIKEGARLVTSVDDILDELSQLRFEPASTQRAAEVPPRKPARRKAAEVPPVVLTAEEVQIMDALDPQGMYVDVLARACGMDIGELNGILVSLRIKRRIKFLSGNRVSTV